MLKARFFLAIVVLFGSFYRINFVHSCTQHIPKQDGDEFAFVQDTARWVKVIHGNTWSIGKLDDAGNFIPDRRFFQFGNQGASSIPASALINLPPRKRVYEFRSGRLIPGDLDAKGSFVPTEGGQVIDFKDYHYGPKAPKIYNLPGKFVPKVKKPLKK